MPVTSTLPTVEQPRSEQVAVEGGTLAVARWGDPEAPAVLAVHGLTSSHAFWMLVAAELGDEVSLLAPDLRGRGRSGAIPGPFGIDVHARDLVAVLDAAGAGEAVVVGHSMGGFVAAVLAVRSPERVSRLVLVDGGAPLTDPLPAGADVGEVLAGIVGPSLERLGRTFASSEEYRARWRSHPAFGEVPEALVQAYSDADLVGEAPSLRSSVSAEAVRADAAGMLQDRGVFSASARATCPVVLLHAERGMLDEPVGLYSSALLERARRAAPRTVLRAVPGTNHFTIGMSPHGAAAIASTIREAVAATTMR